MSAPLVSVVIPTRDRNATLALCLDRLAPGAQTLPADQYEVVVTDDSEHAAARSLIEESYPWARWVAGPRRGPSANRNAGGRAASGEWLAFTDDDCLPTPGWLAAFADEFGPNERSLLALEGRTTCRAGLHSPRQTAPINLAGGLFWSCNFAMRRAGFLTVGGFDERFPYAHMEDADLYTRLRKSGYMTRFVPAAEVDHPPRALPWGTKLARMHEASVLYMVLHNETRGLPWYLVNQTRARLSRIVRGHKSLDTATALASLPLELGSIALHWREWHSRAHTHAAQRA